jgi:regulator of sigma E protease
VHAIAFLVVIGIVVFAHELGHYLAGRLAGVRIYEFALGFGPRVASKKIGETVYAIRAFPLGGMTRFAGMAEGLDSEGREGRDDPRGFARQPFVSKAFIIAAGPLMNFLLAVIILTALFAAQGVPVASVATVLPDSPAAEAGLRPRDMIRAINGRPVASVGGFISTVSSSWGKELRLRVEREGQTVEVSVIPRYDAEAGMGRIGVTLMETPEHSGLAGTVTGAARYTWGLVDTTISSVGAMLTGRLKPEVSGPIGIADISAQAARAGFSSLLMLIALLSTSLGLLNLMPIPILDGGWLVLLALEAARGKPLTPEVENMARLVGLALIVLLLVYATVNDISRLVGQM